MELKAGYKRTEVGVIPDDWDVKPLGDIFTFQNGVNADKSSYGKGIAFINVLEVITYSTLTDARVPGRVLLSAKQRTEFSVRFGDVLFNRTSETQQEVGLASVYTGVGEVVFGGFVIRGRPRARSMDPIFSSYALRSPAVRTQIVARGQGAIRANIGQHDLSRVLLFLPNRAEQEAIAEALSDAESLLESLVQLIAKKRKIKQGAMQELLSGNRRLPGFGGVWQRKKLGEIGESLIGLTYEPSNVKPDGLLVLRASNIFQETIRFEDNVFVDMDVPAAIILRRGDILICVRNGSRDLIGKCALISEEARGMTFGAFMAVFRTPFYDFVYHQFQSGVIKRQINEHLGATINQITNKSLNSFQIPFPNDDKERTAIAETLNDMDAEIAALEAKLGKARHLKQGMMQELLTGKVRLV